jgi:hypothetical protein
MGRPLIVRSNMIRAIRPYRASVAAIRATMRSSRLAAAGLYSPL